MEESKTFCPDRSSEWSEEAPTLRSIDVNHSVVKKNRVAAETDDNSASSNVCEPVWMPLWESFLEDWNYRA